MTSPSKGFYKHDRRILAIMLSAACIFAPVRILVAQVMEGTIYKIQSDSINFGGGESSSTLYNLGDTMGELGTGTSSSTLYKMQAGYRQTLETYLAISASGDVALDAISGLAGGSSEDTATWTVTTDNAAGYTMSIESTTSPALASAEDSFADYTPSGGDPDYTFSISSTESAFGFSPEGSDAASRFKDNGSACNTGTSETSAKCWDGLSTTPATIAGKTSGNHPGGSNVTVRFRAESGSDHIQTAGSYSADIIVTVTAL